MKRVGRIDTYAGRLWFGVALLALAITLVFADGCGSTDSGEASGCDQSYSGACLDPYSADYDCEGGSGNGPDYTSTVTVVGDDHYGLDGDGDGVGCEPY
jgi:hypothetical protein